MDQQQPREKPVFKLDKDFTDPKSGITVRVERQVDSRAPRFSFCIGRVREDGTLALHLQWRRQRDPGQGVTSTFALEHNLAAIIGDLMAQAQEYITLAMEHDFAQHMDFIARRDESRNGGTGPRQAAGQVVHRPGKTARDHAKKATRK